ncbi:MAG: PadR family transcriptional regulator [Candidatus Freyarchaeota archaeon]|nr:PadR family transcriptional regulator [Candidatus Freyarchaeota archaeon]
MMVMLGRKFFLGFVRIHILYHASKGKVYGAEMIKELKRHGYELSPGTLYPILHSLEKEKYLTSAKETVNGKVRKYYRITKKGERILESAKKKVRELVNEVLEENGDSFDSNTRPD